MAAILSRGSWVKHAVHGKLHAVQHNDLHYWLTAYDWLHSVLVCSADGWQSNGVTTLPGIYRINLTVVPGSFWGIRWHQWTVQRVAAVVHEQWSCILCALIHWHEHATWCVMFDVAGMALAAPPGITALWHSSDSPVGMQDLNLANTVPADVLAFGTMLVIKLCMIFSKFLWLLIAIIHWLMHFDDCTKLLTHLPPAKIFRCIFVNEKFCILTKISLKFVPKGPFDNSPALV